MFTLNVRSHSLSGVSSAALFLFTPALFTAMSRPPSAATVSATILSGHHSTRLGWLCVSWVRVRVRVMV